MKSLAFLFSFLFTVNAFACGAKYELQTELEIDGKTISPKMITTFGETTKSESKDGDIKTTLQVVANEVWDEKHQGDALKLEFKVYQSQGRKTLVDSKPTIIARFGEPAEITLSEDKPGSKPLRLKVTAKKI